MAFLEALRASYTEQFEGHTKPSLWVAPVAAPRYFLEDFEYIGSERVLSVARFIRFESVTFGGGLETEVERPLVRITLPELNNNVQQVDIAPLPVIADLNNHRSHTSCTLYNRGSIRIDKDTIVNPMELPYDWLSRYLRQRTPLFYQVAQLSTPFVLFDRTNVEIGQRQVQAKTYKDISRGGLARMGSFVVYQCTDERVPLDPECYGLMVTSSDVVRQMYSNIEFEGI